MTPLTAHGPLLAGDPHDERLLENTHPAGWRNPTPSGRYNLVVIGAGTAGLVTAIGAAGLGAKVAIVERAFTGGDCLHFGCVPSKALLRAARAAFDVRAAGDFGVRVPEGVEVDFAAAAERMRRLRAEISPNDSVQRMAGLGIDVFLGEARFVAPNAVEVDGQVLVFARAVIATGARPTVPAIEGLAEVGFLTNETVFSLTALPRRLAVLGGGPVGCELAQAFRRFGSEVTLLQHEPRLLPRDDPDAAELLRGRFEQEGIQVLLGAQAVRAERRGSETMLTYERLGRSEVLACDALLLAAGRTPNVGGLSLEAAGVRFDEGGVAVNPRLRTTNRRIYAAGDVCSQLRFTHAADAQARVVLQNALFFGRKKASAAVIPWCTFTDPEIAHVGLTAREARERPGVVTHTVPLREVDRAVLDGETEGFARAFVDARSGRLLGVTLVARHAGEMIGAWVLALTAGMTLGEAGSAILPYPTQAEALRRMADQHNRARLTPRVRSVLAQILRWRR